MNTLYLEKRGCNFFKDDYISEISDIGNYRVCTKNDIKLKDGYEYFLEFTRWNKQVWRYNYKNNPNKKLKTPVLDRVIPNLLCVSNTYCKCDDVTGKYMCFCNLGYKQEMIDKMYSFTKSDILKLVNEYSDVQYDDVKII